LTKEVSIGYRRWHHDEFVAAGVAASGAYR